jgi:hypothetical protein
MRSRPPLSRVVYAKAFDGATIVPRLACAARDAENIARASSSDAHTQQPNEKLKASGVEAFAVCGPLKYCRAGTDSKVGVLIAC